MTQYKWENYSEKELYELILDSNSLKDFTSKIGYKTYTTKIKNQILTRYPSLFEPLSFLSHGGADLSNQRFSKLTVVSFNPEESKKQHHRCWNCKCDCGRKTIVRSSRLIKKEIKSCLNCSKRNDLTNKKFGKLTPLYIDEDFTMLKNDGRAYWYCECECGGNKIVSSHNLERGITNTCGCGILSKGEKKIEQVLLENNISYKKQYSFSNLLSKKQKPLRFDFAIFNKEDNIEALIEYQGQQHYSVVEHFGGEEDYINRQESDQLKKDFCKENNILLIEIPYMDYNKINYNYIINKIQEVDA